MPTKTFYSWEQFLSDMEKRVIPALNANRSEFTGVMGLPRGGLMMAVIISHQLGIPLILWGSPDPMVQSLIGGSTRGAKYEHKMTQYVSSHPLDRRILVADDVADTGKRLASHRGNPIVTLFYHRSSIIEPTWWFNEKTENSGFIIFPWEKE
ncbi:MAG: hypothetical protein HYW90_01390 [Candidatus Sungbacteria bacterium]|nr:hypothetical protein [Candidatus Sungbacteria bacterium]